MSFKLFGTYATIYLLVCVCMINCVNVIFLLLFLDFWMFMCLCEVVVFCSASSLVFVIKRFVVVFVSRFLLLCLVVFLVWFVNVNVVVNVFMLEIFGSSVVMVLLLMLYTFSAFVVVDANFRVAFAMFCLGVIVCVLCLSVIVCVLFEVMFVFVLVVLFVECMLCVWMNLIVFVDDVGDESVLMCVDVLVMEEVCVDDEDDEVMNMLWYCEFVCNIVEVNWLIECVVVMFFVCELRGFAAGSARRVEERIDVVEDVVWWDVCVINVL